MPYKIKGDTAVWVDSEDDIQKMIERQLDLSEIPYISRIQYRCPKCGFHGLNAHLAGFPDIAILDSAIELKAQKTRVRFMQKVFYAKWKDKIPSFIARGREKAQEALKNIILRRKGQ